MASYSAPPTNPRPLSTWRARPSSAGEFPGPSILRPISPRSMSSKGNSHRTSNVTTWPNPKLSPCLIFRGVSVPYRGRRVRTWLQQLASPADGPLFGFRDRALPTGSSAESGRAWPSSRRIADLNYYADPMMARPGTFWMVRRRRVVVCGTPTPFERLRRPRPPTVGERPRDGAGLSTDVRLTTLSQPLDGHCYKSCTGCCRGLTYLGSFAGREGLGIAQPKTMSRWTLLRASDLLKKVSAPSELVLEAT